VCRCAQCAREEHAVGTPLTLWRRMSALGQKQTFEVRKGMSAYPFRAMNGHRANYSITSSAVMRNTKISVRRVR
jgi:hypothetical protein